MTADERRPYALRDADGQTAATAGGSARESAAGPSGAVPANPVAARRNAASRNDPADWIDDREAWASSTRLIFVCTWRGQVIEPRMGIASVDVGQAQARARAVNAARKRGRKLDQLPPRSRWAIVHQGCHQPAMHGTFVQELTRLRTVGQVLNVTLAMIDGQAWLLHTNWRATVHRLLKAQNALRNLGDVT
jgi:hypothetical protein